MNGGDRRLIVFLDYLSWLLASTCLTSSACLVQGAAGLHHAKEGSNSCFNYFKSQAFLFESF